MSDETQPDPCAEQPKQQRAAVLRISAPEPFPSGGQVTVEVDKPDTMSGAQLSLKSSVSMSQIAPNYHQIDASATSATKSFTVTFQGGTSGQKSVTFTATVKQTGHADHSLPKTVQL